MPEPREFDWDEYEDAIAFLEELMASGVARVLIERWGAAGWVPWFGGPPALGVYGLARAQEIPSRPRIRIGPSEEAPTARPELMLV